MQGAPGDQVGPLGQAVGEALGQGHGHGDVVGGFADARALEDGHESHGGEQGDGGGLHLGEGGGPGLADLVAADFIVAQHAVQEDGDDGNEDEGNGAGQVHDGDVGGHAFLTENVGSADVEHGVGDQALQMEGGHAGEHEDETAEHVGQPGHELAHVFPVFGHVGRLDFADPGRIPLVVGIEVPGAFGHADALLGELHEHAEADDAAEQGGQFGTDGPGEDEVGHAEADGGEQAVLPGGEAFAPGLVLAVVAGHEAQQEDGQDEEHGQVHEGDVFADGLVHHGGIAHAEGGHGETFNGLEALEHGGAHGAEGHGNAVEGEADDGGAEGREAETEQQRSGKSGGGAEAGRAFDEGGEHEADDDGLHAAVGADFLHAGLDGFHGAAVGERVVDEQSTEDDDEHACGGDEAFEGESYHPDDGQLPYDDGENGARGPCQGHGAHGRPAQADHENQRHQKRCNGEQCQQFNVHSALLYL